MSDAPNSSWHPAMMPNSTAELALGHLEDTKASPAQVDSAAEDTVQPDAAGEQIDAWIPDQDDGGNWLADTHASAAYTEVPEQPAPAESAEGSSPEKSTTASKHFSTMSFTRTVPHEVNWNDDDEVEFTLPRTSTDPFKFMPESNRTNSFPPVSPLANVTENETPHELEQPISFNQAEELVHEIEQEERRDEPLPDATTGSLLGDTVAQKTENGTASHESIGGSFGGPAGETPDARFEEGVPLVSSAQQDSAQQGSTGGGHNLFAEDAAGEEDDFFSNVRTEDTAQPDDSRPNPLERNSTMDVLNSMDRDTSGTGFIPLTETSEESETEGVTPQPQETQESRVEDVESAQGQPTAEEGGNLDAKWKEMFADDEDEDFLPDEGTEAKELDASAFLGSDDEGLLEDSEAEQPEPSKPLATPGHAPAPAPSMQTVNGQYLPSHHMAPVTASATNPYLPTASPVTPANPYLPTAPANPYLPAAPAAVAQPPVATAYAVPATAPPAPARYGYGAPPPPQEKSKAQSFVDKSKGGYTSPYDLPMEVVKPPKRRTSAQPLQSTTSGPNSPAAIPPPPRSASVQARPPPPPPSSVSAPGMSRPGSSHSSQGPPTGHKPSHESFFEELPITTKPRPASRHSQRSTSPQLSPYGLPSRSAPPSQSAPPSVTSHPIAPPPGPSKPEAGIPELVAPPRVNPYASLNTTPGLTPAVPAAASTRYSPAPPSGPQANGPVPAPASSRYSPAPPAARQPSGGYGPVPTTPGPPVLPHQPRTSSPLAHFEISHERSRPHALVNHAEVGLGERRSSSSLHESRLQRVPSLPPTREVEEEEATVQTQTSPRRAPQPSSPPVSRYAPPPQARQTPPPSALSGQAVLSPPKRAMSSHSPLAPPYDFAPPPRSQTQSPGALYGNRGGEPAEPVPRPSSVNDPTSPRTTGYPAPAVQPVSAAVAPTYGRPRGASLNLNVIPPTDGRENDPLQRWRGAPLISWGVGGTFVTMFPKEVPRYGMNQSVPAVVRSPGAVKIQNVKDITPLEERLSKFPGPLKGKSKKKETIAWLTTGIESLERGLPTNLSLHAHLSHEDKRAVERVLLWKILRVFVEHDGVLEGNPAVEKAVRDILSPGPEASESAAPYMNGAATFGLGDGPTAGMQSDGVSSSTVEQIRRHLLTGDCEKAVWAAVDQRLWGHALLLSNALAPNLYKQVAQEFVKKEVNVPGHNNESLAALYEILAGNHDESVDELVPVHARAGLQLMATNAASGPSKDAMEGLDKWRDTLSLILSNRSPDDVRGINSLGVLLSGYGRAEAAHICFMFARSHTVFGGLDDPNSHFVLVGSDHKKQAEQFAKEIEPLLLSEVYEFGQSLAGGSSVPITNPHLAAYKLQHALALAEYGFSDKALQYCDAIATAITSQTKRSPYHHPILENAVEDLMRRLKQAPKEESASWIPKPSMNKVSDTMWSKFNKFVSGEDEGSGQGPSGEGESGPFARVAGGTPTISRSPSVSNLETFGPAAPSYGMPTSLPNGPVPASAPPTRAASRYAPGAPQSVGSGSRPSTSAYAPRSSMERTSSELNRGSFELSRRSLEQSGPYSPAASGSPAATYSPHGAGYNAPQESPYNPVSQVQRPLAPTSAPPQAAGYAGAPVNGESRDQGSDASSESPTTSGYQPPSYGYEPPSLTPHEAPAEKNVTSDEVSGGSSYEPPSYQPYGYEPHSYEPDPEASKEGDDSAEESRPKPKKKGIMYDDDDDFPAPKPAEKTKEEKDRENAEMFRKAAEEDAKRAEAAKQTKKGWGFTSWFGGGAKKETSSQESSPNKPIRAKLGEPNSFYYDPELKRWVNKNAGPEDTAKKATPPPPRSTTPRSVSANPATPPGSSSGPETGRASAPPTGPPRAASASVARPPTSASESNLPAAGGSPRLPPPPGPVSMLRSASNTSTASAPPLGSGSRPPTSLSNSSSIDDLLSAAGPRKPGAAKKPRKGARYVDVMGKS
ncbi:Sec23-binding domain of Sec16-domain-containing protein [Achaetomium macrosporum]|uniref:Protein transport protein sec16 n=1 Tax=Achaetomium macrosporum TaxID=79813 RepID=A0AAN7C8B5_9PEZI|nr:Sec23-binding domain of Sec16-domain-containing protein [Achaetomium macrosporum]